MEKNMKDVIRLYTEMNTFELDERFSYPLRKFYFNLKSLFKYWILTRDMVAEKIHANSEFFKFPDEDQVDIGETDFEFEINGDEAEHDYDTIPYLQKQLILCSALTLVETLLSDVCTEINQNLILNGKGSYIQQYSHFLKQNTSIKISKKNLKDFEAFGHVRNAFIHHFGGSKIPTKSAEYINELCGEFLKIESDVSNVHVDLLLQILCEFGVYFQSEYWRDFEKNAIEDY
jgi:hypothetical protein